MKNTLHTPIRTCATCRKTAPRSELIRLVIEPTTTSVVVDHQRSKPGRGVWVHPQPHCLKNCFTSLAGRFRYRGPQLDVSQIEQYLKIVVQ